jgi:uracil-DNA glycosylase
MKMEEQLLKWYQQMGVEDLCVETPGTLIKPKKPVVTIKNVEVIENNLVAKAKEIANACNSLKELKEALENFEGLSITKTATNTVFSDGNENAPVMAIGEAPGANEDEEGIPFCGMSGQLLDKILLSIGLSREKNLYITNSVFWRPPGNRKPTIEENAVCLPFVEKHIALKKPKLILLVGSTSAAALLNTTETISRLRSKFYQYKNDYMSESVPVAVIFHPSYLLRQPLQKKTVWFDLLKIRQNLLGNI